MPTYLYLHKEENDTVRNEFRGEYELCGADYEFTRDASYKGEVVSEMKGGIIKVTINGFGDELLFNWLFRPDMRKDGEIVTVDIRERVIEKLSFAKARAVKYNLRFDSGTATAAVLTIDAEEMATDNDLYYERR